MRGIGTAGLATLLFLLLAAGFAVAPAAGALAIHRHQQAELVSRAFEV